MTDGEAGVQPMAAAVGTAAMDPMRGVPGGDVIMTRGIPADWSRWTVCFAAAAAAKEPPSAGKEEFSLHSRASSVMVGAPPDPEVFCNMGAESAKHVGVPGMLAWRPAAFGEPAAPEAYNHGGGGEFPLVGFGVGCRGASAASSSCRASGAGEACVQDRGGITRGDARHGLCAVRILGVLAVEE